MNKAVRNVAILVILAGLGWWAVRAHHPQETTQNKITKIGLTHTPLTITGVVEAINITTGSITINVGTPAKHRTLVVKPADLARIKLHDIVKAQYLWGEDKAVAIEVVKPKKPVKKPSAAVKKPAAPKKK